VPPNPRMQPTDRKGHGVPCGRAHDGPQLMRKSLGGLVAFEVGDSRNQGSSRQKLV